jgi:UDPglucose 6-dehydrogenase
MSANEKPAVGVIGVGWVGLVSAACFAELGHPVHAVDIDERKIETLRSGATLPIHEPGLEDLVERNRERLHFTTEIGGVLEASRVLFCCVDTPPTYSGDADLSRVEAVVERLPERGEHALVMKSTVPAGTGAAIRRRKPDLPYVSCPEFLKEGTAVADFLHPDRVVIGADPGAEWAADAVAELYAPLGGELVRTDVASAEMIKLASNAFLATKISFINEIANVCEGVGADVTEVARGMGLDARIGPKFLQAGIGYGGSCFAGDQTLLLRVHGSARLLTFEELWDLAAREFEVVDGEAVAPVGALEVWSWVPGEVEPEWMPVSVLTKRAYDGEMIEVRTKMGRRVKVTADHPFVVGNGRNADVLTRVLAKDLDKSDWVALALGAPAGFAPARFSTNSVTEDGVVSTEKVRVHASEPELVALASRSRQELREVFADRDASVRMHHIRHGGLLRLDEAVSAGVNLGNARLTTPWSRTSIPPWLSIDESFWRVVGLYLAEGCVLRKTRDASDQTGLVWSFHPELEQHLVDEVVRYWEDQGIRTSVNQARTSRRVYVHARLIASWWTHALGLGRNGYEQRLPNLVWEQSLERKKALLSGLWEGDGYLKLINAGKSPVLIWGTVSDRLAEGVTRLLGDVGIVASWERGRTRLSTKETHWLAISGSEQVERAQFLVPELGRTEIADAAARQRRRMRPAGFRRFANGIAWVRIAGKSTEHYRGPVYSLKVPGSQTVVTSGGLTVANCFPKDTQALKQLAGNTGYHFQLLTSVIEVNELQKRRVISKLVKHLGSLVGRRIALLGLAFKPDTDDMREASSLVLSARLQGEGANVVAYDPVADSHAGDLLPAVDFAASAGEALEGADGAVLVTEWPEFGELDWEEMASRMANPLLVDGRNFLDPARLRGAGFTYEGIGRPSGDGAEAQR